MPTIAYLQVVVMKNKEVISMGKSLGQVKEFGAALIRVDEIKEETLDKLATIIISHS